MIVDAAARVNRSSAGLTGEKALAARRAVLTQIDEAGLLATPGNSAVVQISSR